ncbi:MAG: VOC family protein [Chitinophagales bacterium]
MKFVPYITLNGNAAEAVDFYVEVFGAKNKGVMRFGDMPNPESPLPEEARRRVLHAEIEVEGNLLFFSDTFPGRPFTLGDQLAIAVLFTDEPKLRAVYGRLSDGGRVLMELQKTFWSPAYAMVTDKFGVTWQLSLEAH